MSLLEPVKSLNTKWSFALTNEKLRDDDARDDETIHFPELIQSNYYSIFQQPSAPTSN
jgi:hypothetical protein